MSIEKSYRFWKGFKLTKNTNHVILLPDPEHRSFARHLASVVVVTGWRSVRLQQQNTSTFLPSVCKCSAVDRHGLVTVMEIVGATATVFLERYKLKVIFVRTQEYLSNT